MAKKPIEKFLKLIVDIHPKETTPDVEDIQNLLKVLDEIDLELKFNSADLKNIPENGSFIIVSNHPFGGIDGLILLKALHTKRPDTKILSTELINKIDLLKNFTLQFSINSPLGPYGAGITQIRKVMEHLGNNHPLIIFPAGEVSTYNIDTRNTTDRRWKPNYINFIKDVKLPVIPAHIGGTNGNLFHILGSIHPTLGSAMDLISKRNRDIKIRFGTVITPEEIESFSDLEKFGRYLRSRTYALDNNLDVPKFFVPRLRRDKGPQPIIDKVPTELLTQEVDNLRKHYKLFESNEMTVFCAPSGIIPNLMKEIGRLREVTFRAVGEGTNLSIDIDECDIYYYHLFIWDEKESKIVGAYRVGKGKDIVSLYGINGFYISSLFKLSEDMFPILEQSLELGRSFIVQEYQRKPFSLFLLWKGILYFLLKNPEYRYLIGPVSISNQYSKFSKELMIRFIQEYHFDHELAKMVKPRTPFKPNLKFDPHIIVEKSKDDMNQIDKIISEIDPENYKMPVLLKKYLKQNARIIGFNIDPKFNDALDGLIILDLFDVPFNTIESLSKEIDDQSILDRFNKNT
ncbi:MAG TPA: lysophospholipid acyltransferase family protein [Salinivirgaceae bacterium]|nr:lysophospholipid acyltransferase family protein [Salinivirgaceae bacterium]